MAQPGANNHQGQAGATQTLGGFEIVRKLGQGAMGAVFLARQVSMDREVALKVLPQSLAKNKEFVQRFFREAHAAAQLSHVNIVQAIDVGQASGYYYFAMEFVDGLDLRKILDRDGALPLRRALEITHRIASALDYAHTSAGIIHRDIKPENILIAADGTPKLTDLGLARNVEPGDTSLTKTGIAMGTPNYISPEQVRGEAGLDGRTDVYSLGATLYHLLTGQPPYKGGTPAEVMAKHLTQPVPDARSANPQVSPAAAAIISKAMAKVPQARYPTARAFANDVALVLDAKTPAAAAAAAGQTAMARTRVVPGLRRRRARRASPWPYVAALVALLVIALITWLALTSKPDTEAGTTPGESKASEPTGQAKGDAGQVGQKDPSARKKADSDDPAARRKAAAEAAFALLAEEAKEFEDERDYDGAIAAYGKVAPEFSDLLSGRARQETERLNGGAKGLVNPVIAKAEALGKKGEPDKGLSELKNVEDVKYQPLAERMQETRRALEKQAHELTLAGADESARKLLAENAALYKTYYEEKCKEKRAADVAKVMEKYGDEWSQLGKSIKDVEGRIAAAVLGLRGPRSAYEAARRRKNEARQRYEQGRRTSGRPWRRGGFSRRFDGRADYEAAKRDYERARASYEAAKRDVGQSLVKDKKELGDFETRKRQLRLTFNNLKKRISSRDRQRKDQVKATYEQHRTALSSKERLSTEQMIANYEAALQIKTKKTN